MKERTEQPRSVNSASVERSPAKKPAARKPKVQETDEHRLLQRAKQVAYGENTPGYANFLRILETDPNRIRGPIPVKPTIGQKCSKRSWDGQIRKWRRALHMYDAMEFSEDVTSPPSSAPQPTPGPPEPPPAQTPPVRYTAADLLALATSPLVATSIPLPADLHWLDKDVDLEEEFGEWYASPDSPRTPKTPDPAPAPTASFDHPSPSGSVGHCDDITLDLLAAYPAALRGGDDREPPWFPLDDYLPAQLGPDVANPKKSHPHSSTSSSAAPAAGVRFLQDAISYFTAPEAAE